MYVTPLAVSAALKDYGVPPLSAEVIARRFFGEQRSLTAVGAATNLDPAQVRQTEASALTGMGTAAFDYLTAMLKAETPGYQWAPSLLVIRRRKGIWP